MPKGTPRPGPLSGAGRGKGLEAHVFWGPVRPVMKSTLGRPDQKTQLLRTKGFLRGLLKGRGVSIHTSEYPWGIHPFPTATTLQTLNPGPCVHVLHSNAFLPRMGY